MTLHRPPCRGNLLPPRSAVSIACTLALLLPIPLDAGEPTRGYAPAVHSRAYTSPHDLAVAPGFLGRLGAITSAGPDASVALVTLGGHRAVELRVSRASAGDEAALAQPLCTIEQFRTERSAGRAEEFTTIHLALDLELDYPLRPEFDADRRLDVLRFESADGAAIAGLSIAWADGAPCWLQRDGNATTSAVAVPPPGARFQLRVTVERGATGVGDGRFVVRQRESGGSWVTALDLDDRAIAGPMQRFVALLATQGGLGAADRDPALRLYAAGWAAPRGYNASAPGGGESFADDRMLVPYLEGWTSEEIFDHVERDPTAGCMTLDVTAHAARLRVALDPGEGAADWPAIHAALRWGSDPAALDALTAPVPLDPVAGHVGIVALEGLAPGTRYWWRPVYLDDPTAPERRLEPGTLRSFVTKDAIGVVSTQRRFVAGSCAKGWGGHLPHGAIHWAGALARSGLADGAPPEVFILQDDIHYPDEGELFHLSPDAFGAGTEGGAAYETSDYVRIFRQWLDDPAHRGLFDATSVHLMYGDHLVHNNWSWSWWHSGSGGSADQPVPDLAGYPRVADPRRGPLVDRAMTYFAGSFAAGFIGAPTAIYANPSGPGRIVPSWRAWKSGRCHLIQLDTRSFFGSGADANRVLGDDQFAWLVAQLADPDCPLKILCSPSPVGDFMTNHDNWRHHPASRAQLLDAINDHLPPGHDVLILTGDRHIPFVATHLRDGTVSGASGPVPRCIGEVNASPIQSAFPGVFTDYPFAIDADPSVLWCLRGSESKFPELENTAPSGPEEKDEFEMLTVIDVDETTGRITVTFLDGATGAIMDDGKGRPGQIVLTSSALACRFDLDGDGAVGFGDLLALLSAWGPCAGPCPHDLDGDGAVGFGDLVALLAAWGPCV